MTTIENCKVIIIAAKHCKIYSDSDKLNNAKALGRILVLF